MKNVFFCFLFISIFCFSCIEEQGIAPTINIDSIYVNHERWDVYESDLIPRSSFIEIFTTLQDNEGGGLYTFNVESNCAVESKFIEEEKLSSDNMETLLPEIIVDVDNEEDINSQMNYNNGSTVVFIDDINETKVIVKTEVSAPEKEEIEFNLLLNLNTKDAGSLEKITFKFEKETQEN